MQRMEVGWQLVVGVILLLELGVQVCGGGRRMRGDTERGVVSGAGRRRRQIARRAGKDRGRQVERSAADLETADPPFAVAARVEAHPVRFTIAAANSNVLMSRRHRCLPALSGMRCGRWRSLRL